MDLGLENTPIKTKRSLDWNSDAAALRDQQNVVGPHSRFRSVGALIHIYGKDPPSLWVRVPYLMPFASYAQNDSSPCSPAACLISICNVSYKGKHPKLVLDQRGVTFKSKPL